MPDKAKVIAEVRQFARERDAQMEKIRMEAPGVLARELNVQALMINPEVYLRHLFVYAGGQLIQKVVPEAQKTGETHAKKLESINNLGS